MEILPVELSDAEELLEIYAPYVSDTAVSFEYEVPSVEEFRGRIETISARLPYIKAVENGEILGYAYAAPFKWRKSYDWAVETTIYVKQDARRKGLGRALYDDLEKRLGAIGILNMNACIAMPEEEDLYLTYDSVRFHEKMGFEMVGVFHKCGYKFERWYNMTWMEKMIGEHISPQPSVAFGKWREADV